MSFRKRGSECLITKNELARFSATHSGDLETQLPESMTPLERQFVGLKRSHPDVLLFVECGYKMVMYGRDAEIAAKHLHIVCFRKEGSLFHSASIPVHRIYHHVSTLVYLGYKVGVVRQTESAYERAEEGGKGIFERSLQEIYTAGTWIMCKDDAQEILDNSHLADRIILVSEVNKVIAWVSLWEDQVLKMNWAFYNEDAELENHLGLLQPADLLLPRDIAASRVFRYHSLLGLNRGLDFDHDGGMIHLDWFDDDTFSKESLESAPSFEGDAKNKLLERCRRGLELYLNQFTVHIQRKYSLQLSNTPPDKLAVRVPYLTLRELGIIQSEGNSAKGSLFDFLNRTMTPCGARLLQKWLTHPIRDTTQLNNRYDTVEFFVNHGEERERLRRMFLRPLRVQDLERQLQRIVNTQASVRDLFLFLRIFSQIGQVVSTFTLAPFTKLPLQAILDAQKTSEDLLRKHETVDWETGTPGALFKHLPNEHMEEAEKFIFFLENEHKAEVCKILQIPLLTFAYQTISGLSWLIEIPHAWETRVPSSWILESRTKNVTRYHTPTIKTYINKIMWAKLKADELYLGQWTRMLQNIEENWYSTFRRALYSICMLDCLQSLACVASAGAKYVRPAFANVSCFEVEAARHPQVEQFCGESYVPNPISLSLEKSTIILTGPNTGGKSVYLRMVGTLALLAQMGSFVPADSLSLSPFDGIFTHMGEDDDVPSLHGNSTFMLEMRTINEIMRESSPNSLVLLDEVGRGTSTFDGTALAFAILTYFMNQHSFTIFVTHFASLSELCPPCHPYCMGYAEIAQTSSTCEEEKNKSSSPKLFSRPTSNIVMSYRLQKGVAPRSFGLNVARLAGLPFSVMQEAERISQTAQRVFELKKWLRATLVKGAHQEKS